MQCSIPLIVAAVLSCGCHRWRTVTHNGLGPAVCTWLDCQTLGCRYLSYMAQQSPAFSQSVSPSTEIAAAI